MQTIKKYTICIGLMALFMLGCATAKVVISPNFNFQQHKRITVLPFINNGKEGYNFSEADKVSTQLMEMGFVVVERTQLEAILSELKLELSGVFKKSDLNKIGNILNIDVIIFGNMSYYWSRGGTFVSKNSGFSVPGEYRFGSGTIKFVDVKTGEIIISTYADDANFSNNIMSKIKRKLFPAK